MTRSMVLVIENLVVTGQRMVGDWSELGVYLYRKTINQAGARLMSDLAEDSIVPHKLKLDSVDI